MVIFLSTFLFAIACVAAFGAFWLSYRESSARVVEILFANDTAPVPSMRATRVRQPLLPNRRSRLVLLPKPQLRLRAAV